VLPLLPANLPQSPPEPPVEPLEHRRGVVITFEKSMFIACADRHAAIETWRSSRRLRPPETEVNDSTNPGSHDITSRITSGRPTRGSIAWAPCAQLGQASGFRDRVKRRDVQLALIVDRDLGARVNPRGDLLISPVESSGVTGEQLGRVLGQPERPQDRPLGVLPCLA